MTDLVIIDDNAAKKTAKYLGMTVDGYVRSFARGKKVMRLRHASAYADG